MTTAGAAIDRKHRYAPHRVIIAGVGTVLVRRFVCHAPGQHAGPIRADVRALELVTDHGSRWYGCERAYINAELRMVVVGFDSHDEVRRTWDVVPRRLRCNRA